MTIEELKSKHQLNNCVIKLEYRVYNEHGEFNGSTLGEEITTEREREYIGISNIDLATELYTKVSIEYAIGVLEKLQENLTNKFLIKSSKEIEYKISELKQLLK